MRRVYIRVIFIFLVSSIYVTPSIAVNNNVVGSPDIDLNVHDNHFTTNEKTKLNVWISNNGDISIGGPAPFEERVKTARNLKINILEEKINIPIDINTGTINVGSVEEGVEGPYSFNIEIGDIEPGTYRIPIEIKYKYTRIVEGNVDSPIYNDFNIRDTRYVTIAIEDVPEFNLDSSSSERIFVGDTGRLNFSLKNIGTQTAYNPRINVSSQTEGIFFGGFNQKQTSRTVSSNIIEPRSTNNFSVKVGANSEVTPGIYPVNIKIIYEKKNGVTEKSDILRTNINVSPERSFSLENLSFENFRVDEDDATIDGKIVNTGGSSAKNVVVTLSSNQQSITITGSESAVGYMDPGEKSNIDFKLSISEDAEPGNREFIFNVKYENNYGEIRKLSDPISKPIRVKEELDRFRITNITTNLDSGGSSQIEVELKHTGNFTVNNVNTKLFVNDPISSGDDESFLGDMDPGETKTALFTVNADSSAIKKEYTGSIEIRYEDRSGDTAFTDGISIGIPVEKNNGGIPILYIFSGLVLIPIAIGIYFKKRNLSISSVLSKIENI